MATVKLPVLGDTDRRWVFAGAAVVALIVAVAYWRRATNGGDDQGDAVAAVYDPASGGVAAYSNPVPDPPPSGDQTPDGVTGHQKWSQDALAGVSETGRWEPGYIAVVIGKYLAGLALTQAERDVILAAYAVAGYPQPMLPIILVQTGSTPGTPPPAKTPPPDDPAKPKLMRRYVVVVKFTTKDPPWNSYVDGIAKRAGRSRSQIDDWNSAIHGPEYVIHPGQHVYIDPPGKYTSNVEWKG